MRGPDAPAARRGVQPLPVAAALACLGLCWMLITPAGAAPDEPSHLTRAGSLAFGDLDGEFLPEVLLTQYELPDRYLLPDPACYAFQPEVPVSCAPTPPRTGATIPMASRADEYPLWGHLTYGLPTRLPVLDPIWWARVAGAAAALGLVVAAALARRRVWAVAGVVVALTPMAWATVTTVNPSTFGIGGAVALWTAVLMRPTPHGPPPHAWLAAAGWVALALPRRDGLIWACLILVIGLTVIDVRVVDWWRRLGIGPQLMIASSTIATIVWGAMSDRRDTRAVVLSPLIVVVAEVARRLWVRWGVSQARRAGLAAVGAAVGTLAAIALLRTRPGGWDGELAGAVIRQTGPNLEEAVGVLGWLDTTLPWVVLPLAAAAVLVLAGTAITGDRTVVVAAAVTLVVAIGTSWIFELYQGNTSARYWQGRYSLPLLAGVPILLTAARPRTHVARRAALAAIALSLLTLNIAIWAAARRWGVGVEGTLAPWRWGTVHHPIDPLVVLVAHAVVSFALVPAVFGPDRSRRDATTVGPAAEPAAGPAASGRPPAGAG